jgi:Spy/CpxP family protein refolding chaperone
MKEKEIMKKGLVIGLAALVVLAFGAAAVFAKAPTWRQGMMGTANWQQMNEIHQQMIKQHVKDGILTPEQAKFMNEHMANVESMMNGGGNGYSMMGGNNYGMMGGNPGNWHAAHHAQNAPQQ